MERGGHPGQGGEAASSRIRLSLDVEKEEEETTLISSGEGNGGDKGLLRRSPTWGIVLNSIVYMAAPMSMPATMASAGWRWGTAILAFSCASTLYSGVLIGRLCERFPDADSYPKLMGLVAKLESQEGRLWRGDPERARRQASRATHALQFLAYYLDTTAQVLYCAQYLDQLFTHSPICQWQWLLLVLVLVAPLLLIPGYSESRWAALASFAAISSMVTVFVAEVATTQPWRCHPGPSYGPVGLRSVFMSVSAFAYMFGGHGMYPEMRREMKRPQDFNKSLYMTYAVMMTWYATCGYLGFYAYGTAAKANINLNWPDNWLNRLSITVQLAVCYYLVYLTNVVLMLNMEMRAGIMPYARSAKVKARRFAGRLLFVASQVLLAELLLNGEGDVLLSLQSLSGAVGMTALTYFLPYAMYWRCFPERLGRAGRLAFAANIALGCAIMAVGVASSLADVLSAAGGVFQGYCHIPAKYAPDNPCEAFKAPALAAGGARGEL